MESSPKPKLSFRKRLLIGILIAGIALAIAFGAWKSYSPKDQPIKESEEESSTRKEIASIEVVPVESKTLYREDQLHSEIEAYQDVMVYPKVPGFVKWLGIDRGSVVKKGQVIAQMYAPEYLATRNESLSKIAAAKADLAVEESNLEDEEAALKTKQAALLKDQSTYQRVYTASLVPGVIADNDVVQWSQTVEADHQDVNTLTKRVNAKAHEVEMRKQEIESRTQGFQSDAVIASYLQITAPFDGYVTERNLHLGSLVGPDGGGAYPPICRVKQLDLLRIICPVPERDTGGVVMGSKVQFSVSSFPGKRFTGTIARISNTLDKDTRTMPVELNFFNPDYKILPGTFCEVYWPTRRRNSTLFVPSSSVVETPLETFVCRVKDGLVEWVTVRKGQTMGDMIEVFGDIQAGDLVAKRGSEELANQSKVRPVKA